MTPLGLQSPEIERLHHALAEGLKGVRDQIHELEQTHRRERDQLWSKVGAVRSDVDVMKGKLEAGQG